MQKKMLISLLCHAILLSSTAQDLPHAFTGATIYPIEGIPISNGTLIIYKGKIMAVGDQNTAIPNGAVLVPVNGKVILPGFVDTHSHLGGPEGGDASAALHPDTRAMDAVNPTSDGFKKALAGGITTINIMPGSGLLMSGQTIYVKMREGKLIEDLLITNEKGVYGGLKMANGTNPMRNAPGMPGTRAKSAAMVRTLFFQALEYKKKIVAAGKDSAKLPERDLKMEPLLEVLNGKRIVHFHTHKANDVLTAIRLGQEFGFKPVLHHVSEGWKIADEIAKAGLGSSIIVIDAPGGKLEAMNYSSGTGAALEKAGAKVALHTDDGITDSRLFLRNAAVMVREGMSAEKALEAITIAGAQMLDLGSRVGSLKVGKDADFLILSGDPFSIYTKLEQTWVEGKKRFDLSNPDDKKYWTGGYGVYSPDRGEFHHHVDEDH
jgi:imidazolonepropionase-like amidohydrolase